VKLALLVFVGNLASVTAIVAAAVCAVLHVSGWVWFLFVAVCISKTLHWKEGQ